MPKMSDTLELLDLLSIEGPIPRLDEAITHPSFANEHKGAVDYQRLELLGDAVIALCVTEIILDHAPTMDEGSISRARASLVNTSALARFARLAGIDRFLRMGKGASVPDDAHSPKVLADVVEAVVGAVYLARGLDAARLLARRIVGDAMDRVAWISRRDPKSALQEYLQGRGLSAPTYRVVSESTSGTSSCFEVEVLGELGVMGCGSGPTKKKASQSAAQAALAKLSDSEVVS